ncbi:MAG: hypothetical protein ACK5PZ_09705, partial [Pirellula sp.]
MTLANARCLSISNDVYQQRFCKLATCRRRWMGSLGIAAKNLTSSTCPQGPPDIQLNVAVDRTNGAIHQQPVDQPS